MREEKAVSFAVIGHPISQSLSPIIHDYWFQQMGVNAEYYTIDIAPDQLLDRVQSLLDTGISGWNVTLPHKEKIIPLLDRVAPLARAVGAVNTVQVKDGQLIGFNTDIGGFKKYLDEKAPHWPQEKPPLVIGAGGAARAVIAAFLTTAVPFVMITNRTAEKAQKLADDIGQGRVIVVPWSDRDQAVTGAGVIVNSSSLGMVGQPPLKLNLSQAAPDSVYYDIVYKPLETETIRQAKAKGLRTVDGLGMLVYQAALAQKIWLGHDVFYDQALCDQLLGALA